MPDADETPLKRGRPRGAFGSPGARKDHLFENEESLCHSWWYGGGRPVAREDVDGDDDDLCIRCARRV